MHVGGTSITMRANNCASYFMDSTWMDVIWTDGFSRMRRLSKSRSAFPRWEASLSPLKGEEEQPPPSQWVIIQPHTRVWTIDIRAIVPFSFFSIPIMERRSYSAEKSRRKENCNSFFSWAGERKVPLQRPSPRPEKAAIKPFRKHADRVCIR